jgi:hypothetical protein
MPAIPQVGIPDASPKMPFEVGTATATTTAAQVKPSGTFGSGVWLCCDDAAAVPLRVGFSEGSQPLILRAGSDMFFPNMSPDQLWVSTASSTAAYYFILCR